MLCVEQILEAIDRFAPWHSAEDWDHVGLQVGTSRQSVNKLMVALDLDPELIAAGLREQVDGFVVHHPFFFKPVFSVDPDSPQGRSLVELVKHNLFLIAAHTNVDKAESGLSQYLADQLGLTVCEPLVRETKSADTYKVVVFVPETALIKVREAMSVSGAGIIGAYHECSFSLQGYGTFRPDPRAKPWIGERERLNEVPEIRLEMVVTRQNLNRVVKSIYQNHPYEEPALDIYPLLNLSQTGLGRIGEFPAAIQFKQLSDLTRVKLGLGNLRICGEPERPIKRLALCSGSGGSLLPVAISRGADAYLSGDLGYHDFLTAQAAGLAVIDAGHWGTEHGFTNLMSDYLTEFFKTEKNFQVLPSNTIQAEPYQTLV